MKRRLVGSIGVVIATALVVEGLVSLFTGQSLLRRLPLLLGPGTGLQVSPELPPDRQRVLASSSNTGPYWLHPDPRVGLILRPGTEVLVANQRIETSALGLRRRPRPAPPDGATRILVVGASIPFGWGLGAEGTLAYQLEDTLTAVLSPSVPVACYTVAVPRWSHRNAEHFVLGHWHELDPDIVLYMPMGNEIADTPVVTAAGDRKAWPDPSSPHRWTHVDPIYAKRTWARAIKSERLAGRDADRGRVGPLALMADLAPESSRRIDESASSILALAHFVEARGKKFALLTYRENPYLWNLLRRLADESPELPIVPLFRTVDRRHTLPGDPHPNAETQGVMAVWTAESLLDFGWLGNGPFADLPAVPGAYETNRAARRRPREIRSHAENARSTSLKRLQSEIHFARGTGAFQIYGALSPAGLAASGLLVVLKPEGPRLAVELQGLEGAAIYPLDVEVRVDGVHVGVVRLQSGETVESVFEIPLRSSTASPGMEVHLLPQQWTVVREQGILQVASFRPVRIASLR